MALLNARIILALRSEDKNKEVVISATKFTPNGTEASFRKTKDNKCEVSFQDTDTSPEFLYFQTNQNQSEFGAFVNRTQNRCFYLNLPVELNLETGYIVQPRQTKNGNTEELNKLHRSHSSLQTHGRTKSFPSELRVKDQLSKVKGSLKVANPDRLPFEAVAVPQINRKTPKLIKSQKGVLALVVTAFVACWLPFYVLRFSQTYFDLQFPSDLLEVILWTGYCNSALNPVIHSFSNRDFKVAFKKMLNCKC